MKKVLIITYYWPPAGGPGVQRWLKFVKYLKDFEIEPIVYVPENPHYPFFDDELEDEVPEDLEVIKRPIVEPYSLAKFFSGRKATKISSGIIGEEQKQGFPEQLMLYVRGNFFIPDARKYWVKPSIAFLKDYIQEQHIKTIITTGPPHSLHLIGLGLSRESDLRWIADFRDPWTTIGYHEKLKLTNASRRKHEKLEKRVLQGADHIITTSFTTKILFKEMTTTPITVITNGYDVENVAALKLDEEFSLAHIGSLLSGRNPVLLWKALAELTAENEDFRRDFRLKLTGAVGQDVLETINKMGLDDFLSVQDYISHKKALQLQRSVQMLLLIEIDTEATKSIIPGKLFEYMVSGRPILAVGPAKGDPKRIISETNTGKYFTYSEKEEMKEYISSCYQLYRENKLKSLPIGLQKYSRKALTGELVKLL